MNLQPVNAVESARRRHPEALIFQKIYVSMSYLELDFADSDMPKARRQRNLDREYVKLQGYLEELRGLWWQQNGLSAIDASENSSSGKKQPEADE